MLSFEEFMNEIVSRIKDYLPEEFADTTVSVYIQEVRKINDIHLHGIVVRKSNVSPSVSPTVYLETPYQEYQNGTSLEDILTDLAHVIVKNTGNCPADISGINDFKKIKNMIRIKLVNAETNHDYLSDKICTPIDNTDLVAAYFIDLAKTGENHATVMITKALFDTWHDIDIQTLHETALHNVSDCASFMNIRTVLSEMCHGTLPAEFDVEDDNVMYVLSSTDKYCGAASMLCPNTMDLVTDHVKRNNGNDPAFFLLPSSIHETLVVPCRDQMSVADLKRMVEEVNATVLAPEDLLSDHVYIYTDHKLKIAA